MEEKGERSVRSLLTAACSLFLAAASALTLSNCQPVAERPQRPVIISETVKSTVGEALTTLKNPVTIHLFEGGKGETKGRETRALLEFMAENSPMITLSAYSLEEGPSADRLRTWLGVSHGPAMMIEGEKQEGSFFFYGFPERKELTSFLDGVTLASGAPANLSGEIEDFLAGLQQEVRIRIFTTPD